MAQVQHLEAGVDQFVSALETHKTRRSVAFTFGEASVVDYTWARATSDTWHASDYYVNMAATNRSGPGLATFVGGETNVSESIGRIMVVPPGYTVRSSASPGSQRSILCALRPHAVERHLASSPSWSRDALSRGLSLDSPEVAWFLRKIHDELVQPGFALEAMIDCLADGLALSLVRAFNLDQSSEIARHSGGMSPRRMKLILDRLHSEGALPRLTELADLCGISVRHLTRAFRAETNCTIASYIEMVMVERARSMLESTDVPISEIAKSLGFSQVSSFSHAFRRATGRSPSNLRRAAL